MGSNKRGGGADAIYAEHLWGGAYNRNTGTDDESLYAIQWERDLINLSISRFKWTNLPNEIDARFLELCLCYYALAVFYWDDDYDVPLAVQGAGAAYVNFLQNPAAFTIISPGQGYSPDQQVFNTKVLSAFNQTINYEKIKQDPKKKAFPIWANPMRTPEIDLLRTYARRLAMYDRTIEINVKDMRKPRILKANQDNQLTLTNIVRQADQGADIIVVSGSTIDTSDIEVLDLGSDVKQITELSLNKTRHWNELMGRLGIDNSNQDKKERLVSDEVDANNGQTDSFRYIQLQSRRQGIEHFNRVFGYNIEVDFNVEVEAMAKQMAQQNGIDDEDQEDDE